MFVRKNQFTRVTARNLRRLGKHGRLPKGDNRGEHDSGGGGGDNTGGNGGGQGGGGDSGSNNTGQEFDPRAFWDDPSPSPSPAPSNRDSAAGESGGGGSPGIDQVIADQIKGFAAPEIFTSDAMKAIGESGDYSKINENLTTAMQQTMERSVQMQVQLLQQVVPAILSKVQSMVESSHTGKESLAALREAIPSAKNPTVAPMIEGIYERALVIAKGDKTKAITMTKGMLAHMTKTSAGDLDLTVAATSGDSEIPQGAGGKTNWLEDLMVPK